MTDTPAPETTAKLAAATEDSSATASPPSDWPAFARALEIQRNAARAERDRLLSELADERAKKSDAQIAAVQDITRLAAKHNAVRANNRELKELLVLLARAIHDENWKEIGNLAPRMNAALATPQ